MQRNTTSRSIDRKIRRKESEALTGLIHTRRRNVQWQGLPSDIRGTYGSLTHGLPTACSATSLRQGRRQTTFRAALILLFLLSTANSAKALTRTYNYRFVAQQGYESDQTIVTNINKLFL